MKVRRKTKHLYHKRQDDLHQMDRMGQTTLFRLQTGHNRLKSHLYKKCKISHNDLCLCGEAAEKEKMSYKTSRIIKCSNRQFGAAQQTCRPNSGEPLKN
ncbi:hypothetical protein ElyMa_000945800 [Elysia marginata]|uniref:Uncharacterized protein n=1 Tax=Elysia marginata TaxID=1093978 RepID=A0AAV4HCR7_9GAST|nr:hypothetical protein ElyMa_000945800 [Elysia marginata]